MRNIGSVSLVDRRGYLSVVMEIEKKDNLLVRRPENLRDWYNSMQRIVMESKTIEMQSTEEFWSKQVANPSENGDSQYQFRNSQKSCEKLHTSVSP